MFSFLSFPLWTLPGFQVLRVEVSSYKHSAWQDEQFLFIRHTVFQYIFMALDLETVFLGRVPRGKYDI